MQFISIFEAPYRLEIQCNCHKDICGKTLVSQEILAYESMIRDIEGTHIELPFLK